jgi:hypothetical protein
MEARRRQANFILVLLSLLITIEFLLQVDAICFCERRSADSKYKFVVWTLKVEFQFAWSFCHTNSQYVLIVWRFVVQQSYPPVMSSSKTHRRKDPRKCEPFVFSCHVQLFDRRPAVALGGRFRLPLSSYSGSDIVRGSDTEKGEKWEGPAKHLISPLGAKNNRIANKAVMNVVATGGSCEDLIFTQSTVRIPRILPNAMTTLGGCLVVLTKKRGSTPCAQCNVIQMHIAGISRLESCLEYKDFLILTLFEIVLVAIHGIIYFRTTIWPI